jgi:RimJ/RimL family protein N-acetyltransferase
MDPYFLRSDRLGFRTWAMIDIDLALALWGDPRVTRFVGGPFSEAEVRARLAVEIARQASDGIQYWPMFRLADGMHVGCCGLKLSSIGADVLEIGIYTRPEHWGFGYASEASCAIVRHAFEAHGVRALFAGHHPENEDSKRVLLRIGFRYSHHELYPPTGLQHPGYLLERSSSESPKDDPRENPGDNSGASSGAALEHR